MTRLVNARKKVGLSRKQASAAWGLSWRTIENWEQGRKIPMGLYRERIEKILEQIESAGD